MVPITGVILNPNFELRGAKKPTDFGLRGSRVEGFCRMARAGQLGGAGMTDERIKRGIRVTTRCQVRG
jgi:hypothetical protein